MKKNRVVLEQAKEGLSRRKVEELGQKIGEQEYQILMNFSLKKNWICMKILD